MQDIFKNAFLLFGGLGLFLYGMKMMGDGLEVSAGSRLKKLLEAITNNRILGLSIGIIITAIIQSSSATTVMIVGFVNAGLMNLMQAVGVIMGANIGTTVTAFLVSLKISEYTPIAIFLGIVSMLFSKKKFHRDVGQIFAGLGILFLGMSLMSTAMTPFSESESVRGLISYTSNPFFGVVVGMVLTAVFQSSSAVTGILVTMASIGLIDLNSSIFIIYGANIGTCITAVLASLGTNKTAKRAATIHLLFNVIGSTIFIIITLLPIGYVDFIKTIVPENIKIQISVSHLFFNVVTTILLFPCAGILVKLATKIIPGEDYMKKEKRLKYIDSLILNTPPIAVAQTLKEVERMAEIALLNYRLSVDIFLNRNPKKIEETIENEEVINFLNHEITRYLVKINALDLEYNDNKMIGSFFHVVNDIERIGDHAENLVEFSQGFIEDESLLSKDAQKELRSMADNVEIILREAIRIFSTQDYRQEEMDKIKEKEEIIDEQMACYTENHIARLNEERYSPASGMLFINMLNDLERIADHATNIAYSLRYMV